MPPLPSQRQIYSITRLNRDVAQLLATSFPLIWVEGEISNFSLPRSGHMYFSLKDEQAQVRAAMFRNRAMYLGFQPKDGMQVLARAKIALYEPRGDFQLVVEHMEEAGDGALRRAFEALKQKLAAEGLFDPARKRKSPAFPQRIGIITSPSGAALHDALTVLCRRYPLAPVLIYPTQVQGADAPRDIVATLQLAAERQECDVLLLIRGGGSLEDLSAFNDERVARAVAASSIPIVCGVGHEVDFSIADFVADVRAPTPSAAAELISPHARELEQHISRLTISLHERTRIQLKDSSVYLRQLHKRLQFLHPAYRLNQQQQRLDDWERRLRGRMEQSLHHKSSRIAGLQHRLVQTSPFIRLSKLSLLNLHLQQRLNSAIRHLLQHRRQQFTLSARHLDAVSPLATLQRGYAIVSSRLTGRTISHADSVKTGEKLDIRLARGKLGVIVENKH